jgi:hypothetical protein
MAAKTAYVIKWENGGYSRTFTKKSAAQKFLKRASGKGEVIPATVGLFSSLRSVLSAGVRV